MKKGIYFRNRKNRKLRKKNVMENEMTNNGKMKDTPQQKKIILNSIKRIEKNRLEIDRDRSTLIKKLQTVWTSFTDK